MKDLKPNEIEELRLGKMTTRELASWMGFKEYKTYINRRVKHYETLKNFCTFEEVYGGVVIKEIYLSTYVKNLGEDDKTYFAEVAASENNITSISGMVRKLKKEREEYKNIPQETLYKRLTAAGKRVFGITADQESAGVCGSRKYIWAIKVTDFNKYRLLTIEERNLWKKLIKASSESSFEQILEEQLVYESFKRDELTKEDYVSYKTECGFFGQVVKKFKEQTGQQIVRATEHEILMSIFNRD